jgi:uroporphyrinogen-III synthase
VKKILYLGLTLPYIPLIGEIVHCPIIKIVSRSASDPAIQNAFQNFDAYTHLVITSKTTIPLLFEFAKSFGITESTLQAKKVFAVGRATAASAISCGMSAIYPIADETAEGLVAAIKNKDMHDAYFFWPHSALSRSILPDFFNIEKIKYTGTIFYDTIPNCEIFPLPDLTDIDEIVFTSPSTVDAYCQILGPIPWDKQITPIGPITTAHLKKNKDEARRPVVYL